MLNVNISGKVVEIAPLFGFFFLIWIRNIINLLNVVWFPFLLIIIF